MTAPPDDKDESIAPAELLRHSQEAIRMRSMLIQRTSDALAVTTALTTQWLEMQRKLLERAGKRLEVANESIQENDQPDAAPMSYYERSEKFQGVAMENAKDYMQQMERFALGAQVLLHRFTERAGQAMNAEPPAPADE